ncbi:hypothetical protein EBR66_03360 [bacterium]|nr:hypothetical protein [bacterium]
MTSHVYMIAIKDSSSDEFIYAIPEIPEASKKVYISYEEAKKSIMDFIGELDDFIPVAYGDAYPYENTTFDKEISEKGFALIGWVPVLRDEEEPALHIPIGLLKMDLIQDTPQVS